jgi:exodeoxyribonuclease VII small subunit
MARKKNSSFEEKMAELTRLVDVIGRDDCPVDELERMVRRAVELIRDLRSRLSATEISVREVLAELEDEIIRDDAPVAGESDEEDDEDEAEDED